MNKRLLIAVFSVGVVASVASGAPIGTIDIAGLGNVRANLTTIDWHQSIVGSGVFIVTDADGTFASEIGALGRITDLNISTAAPGPPLAIPIDPFIQTPTSPVRFVFNLERIFLGGGAPCTPLPPVGGSCTPSNLVPNSPVLLTQNSGSVGGSLSLRGTVTDLLDGRTAPYKGLFTFNLTRREVDTIDEVLTALSNPGGYVASSWSAELTTLGIPEPATFLLCGAVLLAAGRFRRKRA
jgi:hypothetical protein